MNTRALIPLFALALSGLASASQFALGPTIGATGLGVEGKYAVNRYISVRANLTGFGYDADHSYDGIDYAVDASMANLGTFVDIYPFLNGFHFAVGAYIGDKSTDLSAQLSDAVTIGNQTFTAEQVGRLYGSGELATFAPFLGLGYDGFRGESQHSFNIRAGVMFSGSPDVNLDSADGLLSQDEVLLEQIRVETRLLEDEIADYEFLPVIALGYAYRF